MRSRMRVPSLMCEMSIFDVRFLFIYIIFYSFVHFCKLISFRAPCAYG